MLDFFIFHIFLSYACLHLQSFSNGGAAELFFQKNGLVVGVAFSLDASVLLGRPLFPHVLCKSCSVQLLLDPAAPRWYPGPPGFTPLAALPAEQRVCSSSAPASRAQSEVRGSLENRLVDFYLFRIIKVVLVNYQIFFF